MKRIARSSISALAALAFSIALSHSAAFGGDVTGSPAPAAALPRPVAQNMLRFVEPKPLTLAGHTYSTAQAAPIPPRPGDGGPAVGPLPPMQPMPQAQPMPPAGSGAADVDPNWKPIGAVGVSITLPAGDFPTDDAAGRFADAGVINYPADETRNWMEYSYFWMASGFACGPLYFEEPNLERYGYKVALIQPCVSAAHFFATVPLLPYKMVVHPPHECVYSLGYYRPGDCAPLQHERFHLQADAAAAEAGVVIGTILLLH